MSKAAGLCVESALAHNAGDAVWKTWESFRHTPTFKNNRLLFTQPKGLGYWAWKPWAIYEAMMASGGDVLIYIDAGVKVIDNLNYIVDRMDQDIWLFGNEWQHYQWCKRDIIEAIMPGSSWEQFDKQAQASVMFFKVNEYTRNFVKEWLDWCLIPELVDDSPSKLENHPDFRENRYDQAILTTLAYRDGIKLHGWFVRYETFEPARVGYPGDDYPTLFLHHRIRNDEWDHHHL